MELNRRRRTWAGLGAALVLSLGTVACASPAAEAPPAAEGAVTAAPSPAVPSARVGTPAPSTRIRFAPTLVELPGGAQAAVEPAATADGELVVPENVRHVGWWDGSAYAGDPFGSTVIAGHVDSANDGLGFFARLKRVQRGDVVTVRNDRHTARYRITSVATVAKQALATDGRALDQSGPHRLVLITCTGAYRADRGGYESNLVVTGVPVGRVR